MDTPLKVAVSDLRYLKVETTDNIQNSRSRYTYQRDATRDTHNREFYLYKKPPVSPGVTIKGFMNLPVQLILLRSAPKLIFTLR